MFYIVIALSALASAHAQPRLVTCNIALLAPFTGSEAGRNGVAMTNASLLIAPLAASLGVKFKFTSFDTLSIPLYLEGIMPSS